MSTPWRYFRLRRVDSEKRRWWDFKQEASSSGGVLITPGGRARLQPPAPCFCSSLGALSGGVWMISRASSWVREDAGPSFSKGRVVYVPTPQPWEAPSSHTRGGRKVATDTSSVWVADSLPISSSCRIHIGGSPPDCPPRIQAGEDPLRAARTGRSAVAEAVPDSFGQSGWTPQKTRASTQHGAARSPCHPDVCRALSSFTMLCCLMFSHITLTTTREERRAGVCVSILQMSKQPQDVRQPCQSSHS